MRKGYPVNKVIGIFAFLSFFVAASFGQSSPEQLKIKNYAIWGGGETPTVFNPLQGVFLAGKVSIKGNIGSHHIVDAQNDITIQGSIVSGNRISLGTKTSISGNLTANNMAANASSNAIDVKNSSEITSDVNGGGNITANGKVFIQSNNGSKSSSVNGKVSVPAPTSFNYSGPTPAGGFSNTLVLPLLPLMPTNTPFDNQAGTINITTSQTIAPGKYNKLELSSGKAIKFDGPGNYIFKSVNNTGATTITFDFKNTTTGTINIFVVDNANWNNVKVLTANGNFPSRVITEVHGNGTNNNGNAFSIVGNGSTWFGNVWAPFGKISINALNGKINGALWSAKAVSIEKDMTIEYEASAIEPSYIDPYYPPPATGKVDPPNNKLGSELLSLYQNTSTVSNIPDNTTYRIENGKVLIDVISVSPSPSANYQTLVNQLIAAGMTGIIPNGPHIYTITGYFPINQLNSSVLVSNPLIQYNRPTYPPLNNVGQVTSQGDATMRSDAVKERFGVNGEGVKVGVISDSYNSLGVAQQDVDEGDLPGIKSNSQPNPNPNPVQVLGDFQGHDEGRAMLQIVHDVAPQAKLAFRTGFRTAGDFANAILQLSDPALAGGKCDVIVDDITYITEPFLIDGVVANTVNNVVSQGVTYFSSAGNFGNRSYESAFVGVTNQEAFPSPATVHKFGATNNDVYQKITLKPGSYTIVLQWSDDFHSLGSNTGVQTDLDLYLVGANGFKLFGFNRSNLYGDPFEVCPFTVKEETEAKVMIVSANVDLNGNPIAINPNIRFKYIIFRGDAQIAEYQSGGSTIVGHPNAKNCIAVGAMLYANIPQYTPTWPGVASFSSRGGTGTLEANNTFVPRNKPDIVAPNGVNTTVNLGGPVFDDGDPYPNFFGTSAAAPHAAGVAALLIQAKKKFNLQQTVSPLEVRSSLINTAGKFPNLDPNFSFIGGYGYVQADSAISQIANARPVVNSWEPAGVNLVPGTPGFQVKIKGKYLTNSTQIYFAGTPVTQTVVNSTKTEAIATIPAFANNLDPALQLFNPSKSPSELDGGLSESIHFFSSKKDVTIKAKNQSRKYGQSNPQLTFDVLVDGVPIEQTNLTLAALKLDGSNITMTTFATVASKVGLYGIFPSRAVPLDPNNPTDAALLNNYGFTFVSGTLSIDKMPLKITPNNKVVKYGDYIGDITYNYELDPSQIPSPELLNEIKGLHEKFIADNALAVINGFNSNTSLSVADLANMAAMTSFQAVRNARKFKLNNGQLQAIVNSIPTSEIGDQRFVVDVSAQSLENYKNNAAESHMVNALPGENERTLLGVKSLANGSGKAALSNGQLQAIVNGQLLAMVNGQLQAIVNGQLQAIVNGQLTIVDDLVFRNGQLMALVNGTYQPVANGQLQAIVNGQSVTVELSVSNGQLQAIVNGQLMALVNGQLQAIVNGQLLAIVNGQLQALVNGQLMPMVNGQLMAIVNGQLQALVNGQLMALVNGQLMAIVNGELQQVQSLSLNNGQLQAIVNGQLQAIVNGQLKAMVNGTVTDIPTTGINLVNGQLQAIVNGQLQALVNGQLQAIVNGQLQALVNGEAVAIESVRQLANGQLQAIVNGQTIPLANGQLQALVNGQLLAMVNGQLMALVNNAGIDELTFAVFSNGQLQALVNRQLQALANGQLMAIVNNQVQAVNSYNITNGQLQAIVNGQNLTYTNGQLLALVNGQLQAIVNNFSVAGTNNNANTVAVIDEDDINLQQGSLGGMFAVNMITGLNVGTQKLIPGAFVNENFEVTYGLGEVQILPRPLVIKADNKSKVYGDANPALTITADGLSYGETLNDITQTSISTSVDNFTGVGTYPIVLTINSIPQNYSVIVQDGLFTVTAKELLITADDKTKVYGDANPVFTYTPTGFVNGEDGSVITTQPVFFTTADNNSGIGNYPIIPSGGAAPNYSLVYANGTLSVIGIAPSINCPANITVNNDAGVCGANVTFAATETIGNPASVITYSHAPGSSFPVGSTTVTATATNGIGSSTCTFTVTVVDNEAPVISCPGNISLNLDGSNSVEISAEIINNNVVISSTAIPEAPQIGLLPPQNDLSKTLSGSCDCPPGHAVVGYTGKVGQIVDQFTLICAPINGDGSPGAPITLPCYNGGIGGGAVGPFIAPAGSWMVGFGIGDVDYFGRPGTLTSIEGYSQSYTDVMNGSTNRLLNTNMGGTFAPTQTTVQYAPPGHILTGMNYYAGWEYANTVQFKYIPLQATQELANFAVSDNCSGSLALNIAGNTTYTSANVGANPITLQVTDASGNSSSCTIIVTVADNAAPTIICPGDIAVNNDPGQCGANVTFDATVSTGSTVTYSHTPGSFFPIGTTVVTATASNSAGTSQCTFNVTVTKTEPELVVSGCVNNLVVTGTQNVTVGGTNAGNRQSDFQWQSFSTGNNAAYLYEINVSMTRYLEYVNGFMRARLYQGVGLGGTVLGTLDIPSYNGGVIDFSTINGGFPLQLSPNTSYTLLMNGDPVTFDNNYFWEFSNAVAGDPQGSVSGGVLKMTVKLESCEAPIIAAAPSVTGVGPEGTAISFNGNTYAIDNTPRVPESGSYTLSLWAKQNVNQGNIVEMISQGRNLYIGHEQIKGYDGNRIGNVTSASRSGRYLTDITYDIQTSVSTVESKTTTASEFIKSKLVLSTLTANPNPGGDANRFWYYGNTTLTEQEALGVTGDLDLGTVLQDCADPVGVNHTVLFDKKIYPGEGPEIFIVHGGLSGNFEILDENGNVALVIPYNAGSPVVAGGSVFTSSWNPAFYLRDKVNFNVEALGTHFDSQNGIIAIDIHPGEMNRISGIRFGGGGCNYVYEILGVQPDKMPYELRIGDGNNTNVAFPKDGKWHNYALVRDVAGNDTHLYLDGELVHSKGSLILPPTTVASWPNYFILGAQWNELERFNGNLDEVRIFNYAMNANEIQCNLTHPLSGTEPGLVGYYNLEEGSGAVINNSGSSGGSLNITDIANAQWVKSIGVWGMYNGSPLDASQYYSLTSLPSDAIYWFAPGYNEGSPICTTHVSASYVSSCVSTVRSNQTTLPQVKEKMIAIAFPNPATTSIRVQFSSEILSSRDVVVYDVAGKMQIIKGNRQLSANRFEMDISSLSKGVYFVKAKTNDGYEVLKFVKM